MRPGILLAIASASLAASCSSSSTGAPQAIQVRRTHFAVAPDTRIAISGLHLAFLADEATTGHGTDLNGDGDATDAVAVLVETGTRKETNLGVAADGIAWIGAHLYLDVDEAKDGRDWNGDADTDDHVLLHVFAGSPAATPDFVDELSPGQVPSMIRVGQRLFYSSSRTSAQPGESNLFAVSSSAPISPVRVLTRDASGPLSPIFLSKDEGLLLLALDEVLEGRDLNGDGDATDRQVLALLDGTSATAKIRSTGLAIPALSPLRARQRTAHDWDVGFLVSEADQGHVNLDDPLLFQAAWTPPQCAGATDTDARDAVLHFLQFSIWDQDPVAHPPVNTGLVGSRKIAIANGYIATLTPESGTGDPDGAEGTCDLNGDGDQLDYVVRWTPMSIPVLPLTLSTNLFAVRDVAGGTHGLAELGTRFVIEASESQSRRDLNFDGQQTFDYLGWLLPSGHSDANTPWDFSHGTDFTRFFGGSWVAETPDRSRLLVAMQEDSFGDFGHPGHDLNAHDPPIPGEDADTADSVPVVASFEGVPPFLDLPMTRAAASALNPGIVVAHGLSFSRIDEVADTRDSNGDGVRSAFVLWRTDLATGFATPMGTLNSIPDRPAIELDRESGNPLVGAFIADEHLLNFGTDFDGDGDTTDLVVSYFLF